MWAGVGYGCCLSVGEFKKVARKYFLYGGELFRSLIILKNFRFLCFFKSLAPAIKCHKMRFGGKIFFNSGCSRQKISKLCCSCLKLGCDIIPAKLIFEIGGLLMNYPVSKL